VGGYVPRTLEDIVRPRRLVGASGPPLKLIVRRRPRTSLQLGCTAEAQNEESHRHRRNLL
jgi:hypothetical protein